MYTFKIVELEVCQILPLLTFSSKVGGIENTSSFIWAMAICQKIITRMGSLHPFQVHFNKQLVHGLQSNLEEKKLNLKFHISY